MNGSSVILLDSVLARCPECDLITVVVLDHGKAVPEWALSRARRGATEAATLWLKQHLANEHEMRATPSILRDNVEAGR